MRCTAAVAVALWFAGCPADDGFSTGAGVTGGTTSSAAPSDDGGCLEGSVCGAERFDGGVCHLGRCYLPCAIIGGACAMHRCVPLDQTPDADLICRASVDVSAIDLIGAPCAGGCAGGTCSGGLCSLDCSPDAGTCGVNAQCVGSNCRANCAEAGQVGTCRGGAHCQNVFGSGRPVCQ